MISPATTNLCANAGNFVACALLPRDATMAGKFFLTCHSTLLHSCAASPPHKSKWAPTRRLWRLHMSPLVPVNNPTSNERSDSITTQCFEDVTLVPSASRRALSVRVADPKNLVFFKRATLLSADLPHRRVPRGGEEGRQERGGNSRHHNAPPRPPPLAPAPRERAREAKD